MTKFSHRHGFRPNEERPPVLTDAPDLIRAQYFKKIFLKLIYIDRDSRYENPDRCPLGAKSFYEEICTHLVVEEGQQYNDSWMINDELRHLMTSVEWYSFYDIVELTGKKIIEIESSPRAKYSQEWIDRFGFDAYRNAVNNLFEELNVQWRINSEGDIVRDKPVEVEVEITEESNPIWKVIRSHFEKAKKYSSPLNFDPENSIKESISAIESFGKNYLEGTSTLGDVIKDLRKNSLIPSDIIGVLQKMWDFANKTPGVRHGGVEKSDLSSNDAEYIYHFSVATINYLNGIINK